MKLMNPESTHMRFDGGGLPVSTDNVVGLRQRPTKRTYDRPPPPPPRRAKARTLALRPACTASLPARPRTGYACEASCFDSIVAHLPADPMSLWSI